MARPRVLYDFLKVTDEWLDVRAPALGRLLSGHGRRVSAGDALAILVRLDRHVVRSLDDNADNLRSEFERCGFLPSSRINENLADAALWPINKATALLESLTDPEVRYLEPTEGGWRVRGLWERYGKFAMDRRSSRARTRDNARARSEGWEAQETPDGKLWIHKTSGAKARTLREVLEHIEHGAP